MPIAHVKWFHDFSFLDAPLGFADALSPLVVWMLIASGIAMGSLVLLDRVLATSPPYQKIAHWLEVRQEHGPLVLRIGAGMTLLLSWQADAVLVPELAASSDWIGWFQFALALILIFPKLAPIAGAGIFLLWAISVGEFGLFHMLDYALFIGVAIYLMVTNSSKGWIKGFGIPALYLGLGFSLMWVAFEKFVYPQWGSGILDLNQYLTLGFPTDTFLILVAVTELALGFLLVIGLLGRPLGLVITLVLFSTALTFGKTEVVGHTIIHASLIVFLLEGEGTFYRAPVKVHSDMKLRVAFASVNFFLVSAVLFSIYIWWSDFTFGRAIA
jgi:uncharacterized membrane protein YphA (DoxX/SURF4 family)